MEEYIKNIGKGVIKKNITKDTITNCKFKSGSLINTIKGVIEHPILKIPAYIFEEDDSYVECRRCKVIGEESKEYVD